MAFQLLNGTNKLFINAQDLAFEYDRDFKIRWTSATNLLFESTNAAGMGVFEFQTGAETRFATLAPSQLNAKIDHATGLFTTDLGISWTTANTTVEKWSAKVGTGILTNHLTIDGITDDQTTNNIVLKRFADLQICCGVDSSANAHLIELMSYDGLTNYWDIFLDGGNNLVIADNGQTESLLIKDIENFQIGGTFYTGNTDLSTLFWKFQGNVNDLKIANQVGTGNTNQIKLINDGMILFTPISERPYCTWTPPTGIGTDDAIERLSGKYMLCIDNTGTDIWSMSNDVNGRFVIKNEASPWRSHAIVNTDGCFRVMSAYPFTEPTLTYANTMKIMSYNDNANNVTQMWALATNTNRIQFGSAPSTQARLALSCDNDTSEIKRIEVIDATADGPYGILDYKNPVYGVCGAEQTFDYAAASDTNLIPFRFDTSFGGFNPQQENEYFVLAGADDNRITTLFSGYATISGQFTFQVNYSSFTTPTDAEKYAYSLYILTSIYDNLGALQHTMSSGFAPHGSDFTTTAGAWITTVQVPAFNTEVYDQGKIQFELGIYRGTGAEGLPPTDLSVLGYVGGALPLAWGSSFANCKKTDQN